MARDDVEAHLAWCERCVPHFTFAKAMRSALARSLPADAGAEDAELRYRVHQALCRVAAME